MDERIRSHPSPPSLKTALLSYLDVLLTITFPPSQNPRSLRLLYLRLWMLEGADEVDRLQQTNEFLIKIVEQEDIVDEEILQVYTDFVLNYTRNGDDESLVSFLVLFYDVYFLASPWPPETVKCGWVGAAWRTAHHSMWRNACLLLVATTLAGTGVS